MQSAGERVALPSLVANAGEGAIRRFLEFFAAQIRNSNTRLAYAKAASSLCNWAEEMGLTCLNQVQPLHVAAWIEHLDRDRGLSPASIKQSLAGVRMLFGWLVIGQVVPANPALDVKGPSLVVVEGKTPHLTGIEARRLLDSIPRHTIVGLRDRALISLMLYSLARISAALGMRVRDYVCRGAKEWAVILREKGGKQREIPASLRLQLALDAYLEQTGLHAEPNALLFQSVTKGGGKSALLTGRPLTRSSAWAMIRRRARQAGLHIDGVCNHSLRATGTTIFLENGGTLEDAQALAGHADSRTTKLYDKRSKKLSLEQVERIII